MSIAKTTFPFNAGDCPACQTPLIGQASADVDTTDMTCILDHDSGVSTAKVGIVITGFSINHNCIPKATR
jgi:hypothetical protein